MLRLDRISRQTGASSGQIKSMMETFQRAGVDAAQRRMIFEGSLSLWRT
jgi:hypothetical protein